MAGKKQRAKAARLPSARGRAAQGPPGQASPRRVAHGPAAPGRAVPRSAAAEQIAREFQRRRRMVGGVLLTALLLNAIGLLSITRLVGLGIAPAVLAAGLFGLRLMGIAAASLLYRCPVCQGFLGGSGESCAFLNPVRCPQCGTGLQ